MINIAKTIMVGQKLKISITLTLMLNLIVGLQQVTFSQQFNQVQLDSLISLSVIPIQYEASGFRGDGLNWLVNKANESHYFLIGEKHGSAEIPQMTAALYNQISKIGYDYAALEFGKIAAIKVRELLSAGTEALGYYLSKPENAKAIAFLDWKEEVAMVNNIAKASSQKHNAILGLDHEFIHGAGMYLEMLGSRAKNQDQKELIESLKSDLNENPFLLGSNIKTELNQLEHTFNGKPEALEIIRHLRLANYIYGRFRGEITRIESNSFREQLMKKNLLSYLNNQQIAQSKILFKFGGFHAAPSISQGVSKLGTFVEEWALANGQKAFNLYMDGISGRIKGSGQNAVAGDDEDIEAVSFFGTLNATDYEHPFRNVLIGKTSPVLINLQLLRKHIDRLSLVNQRTRSLINSFDAYMAIPNVTPASTNK